MQEEDTIDRDLTDYRLEHVALEYFKAPATQSELEKVPNMVGTYLICCSDDFLVPTAKVEPEKVANLVATFWANDSNSLQKIKIETFQTEPEKVTIMVGTFLSENRVEFQKLALQP
jgi:hypothetical protein